MPIRNQFAPSEADLARPGILSTFLFAILLLPMLFITDDGVVRAMSLPQSHSAQAGIIQEGKAKPKIPNIADSTNLPSTRERSSLTLPKALLGHWVSEKSKTHMYYSQGKYLSVYSGKAHHGTYTVEEADEKNGKMRIRITPLHSRILTFSADKNEVSDVVEVAGVRATEGEAIT